MRNIKRVEVGAEFGAGTRGASLGPDALRMAIINKQYELFSEESTIRIIEDPGILGKDILFFNAKRIQAVLDVQRRIAGSISAVMKEGFFPFVISGDHSNAAATLAGMRLAHPDKRIGVVWIDAHADLHTPWTTPSGNIHGMPLGMALNLRHDSDKHRQVDPEVSKIWEQLCSISGQPGCINREDVVFIAIRDLEPEEWDIIDREEMKFFTTEAVNRQGANQVIHETLEYLSGCDLIYVTFDVDCLDAAIVPGTGTPVPDGISIGQARRMLELLWASEKLGCMEFTEINPCLDQRNATAEVAADLLQLLLNSVPTT